MRRRVIKPFTVEVRSGGRRSGPIPSASLSRPSDQQPHVALWPGFAELDERPPAPEEVSPASDIPTGRVLPALDQTRALQPSSKSRAAPRRRAVAAPAQELEISHPAGEELEADAAGQPLPALLDEAVSDASTLPSRRGRNRLPRTGFTRGERWKVRLPAVVQRALK